MFKQCNNCGHHGRIFPEVPESEATEKPLDPKEIKEKQLIQTSYGKGYWKFIEFVVFLYR